MSWTTAADLRRELERLWQRGELARGLIDATVSPFPLRLPLKRPNTTELADRFDAVRVWVSELSRIPALRIEWRDVRHRVHGLQRMPDMLWIDHADDALALIGRRRDAERLQQLVAITRDELPALLPWLARRPLRTIELADDWPRLLAVVGWLLAHPRPGVHLREVDVPGVHSKFIEAQRGVLGELLDLALPADAIAAEAAGVGGFSRRYGFRDKPVRIRFRVLDPALRVLPGVAGLPDITLDADSFTSLDIALRRVFITENETNFLAFPSLPDAIVLFGAGYGFSSLAGAQWMQRCELHYWGDIDTHGFAILDQLRGHFGHVASLLMDRRTLEMHEAQWGEESAPIAHDLHRLTSDERALFDDLRDNRIRPRLRLEQERIGFAHVADTLGCL